MFRLSVTTAAPVTALALLFSACGATSGAESPCVGASCASSSGPGTPSARAASAHGWTTTATISGGRVEVRVTVSGPLSVEGGCVEALQVWLMGADGARLEASPTPGLRCQAIAIDDIPAGQTRDYGATMPRPQPGTYTVHGLVRVQLPLGAGARVAENIPVVTLIVS